MAKKSKANQSSWAPLTQPFFRNLWLANLGSNTGSLMQDIASAWLMTSLTTSPVMVALLQTANYLPIFIIGIPAGAIGDLFGRRRLIMIAQLWMLLAALSLGLLTLAGLINPWGLILFTFILSIGAAASLPIFGALIPDLVPKEQLETAVALQSTGRHIARGIGSGLGGILVALLGPGGVYLINAASFLILWFAFFNWRNEKPVIHEKPIGIWAAIRSGIAYIGKTPHVQAILIRAVIFGLPSSAFWALLPLVGREQLGLTAIQYGLMLGCFGIGSLMGIAVLPWSRRNWSLQICSIVGTIIFALSLAAIAQCHEFLPACLFNLTIGISWITIISVLNYCIQCDCPANIRARVLSIFIAIWHGSMALGSYFSGLLASYFGVQHTFIVAACLLFIGLLAAPFYKLITANPIDQ